MRFTVPPTSVELSKLAFKLHEELISFFAIAQQIHDATIFMWNDRGFKSRLSNFSPIFVEQQYSCHRNL